MVLFRLYTFSRNATGTILCQEAHDTDIITDVVNFDHLLNVLSARFLHYEVTIFFVITILWEDTLRLCENPVSHQTFTY